MMKELVRETDVAKILAKLPVQVYIGPTEAAKLGIATPYAIKRGMMGYMPVGGMTDESAQRLNDLRKVTPAQIQAMQVGSMFGWEVPGADPDNY